MLRLTPAIAGGLVTGSAALVAAVLTVVTSTPTAGEMKGAAMTVNRADKSDRLKVETEKLQTILFGSNPIAFVAVMNKPLVPGIAMHEVTVEQTPPKEERDTLRHVPMARGCESGLSPDISPTVPLSPGRCIVLRENYTNVASINA